jgi:hypothetical protein
MKPCGFNKKGEKFKKLKYLNLDKVFSDIENKVYKTTTSSGSALLRDLKATKNSIQADEDYKSLKRMAEGASDAIKELAAYSVYELLKTELDIVETLIEAIEEEISNR